MNCKLSGIPCAALTYIRLQRRTFAKQRERVAVLSRSDLKRSTIAPVEQRERVAVLSRSDLKRSTIAPVEVPKGMECVIMSVMIVQCSLFV
jgi:hypothetical protein